jgi:autotransporter-associated beta strand protein
MTTRPIVPRSAPSRRSGSRLGVGLLLATALLVPLFSTAHAQTTRTWQGLNLLNNDWFSQNGFGNNWTTSVPDTGGLTGEIAHIQSVLGGTPQASASLAGNVTIRGLELDTQIAGQVNVDLTISNATMTINGSGTNFSRIQSLKTLTLNNGTISYNLATFNIDGTIVGNGTLNSPFTFNGPLGGSIIAQGGTLNLNGNISTTGVAGNLIANGGTLNLDTISIPANANLVANNGGTVQYSNGSAITLSRPVTQTSGTGNFSKSNGGTLTWNATGSNYSGNTSVTGGSLQLGASNVIPDASNVSVSGGAVLNLNNQSDTVGSLAGAGNVQLGSGALTAGGNGATTTYSGQLSGNGSFAKTGGGAMTLSGSNMHTGGTNMNGGVIAVTSYANLGGAGGTLAFGGGTLRTDAAVTSTRAVTLYAGGGTVDTNGSSSALNGNIGGAGALTKTGAGTLSLGGTNGYGGGTTVSAGTLQGDSASLQGNIANNAAVVFDQAGAGTYGGNMTGSGALTKQNAGVLSLAGTNSYLGATQINQGGLEVLGGASLGGTSSIHVSSLATLEVAVAGSAASPFLQNAGDTLIDGSFTGDFNNLAGGVLHGSGSISGLLNLDSGSQLAPGNSPGMLAAGAAILGGGATLLFEINDAVGSAGVDSGWDLLDLNGALTINSTSGDEFVVELSSLTLANAPGPAANFNSSQSYSWAFITAPGGITGFSPSAFVVDDSAFVNSLDGGTFSVDQVGNSLVLNFVAVPEPATFVLALAGVVAVATLGRRRRQRLAGEL